MLKFNSENKMKKYIILCLVILVSTPLIADSNHQKGWNSKRISGHMKGCEGGMMSETEENYKQAGYDLNTLSKEEFSEIENQIKDICECATNLAARTVEYDKYLKNIDLYNPKIIKRVKDGECPGSQYLPE